ncbi:hypothetical protein, partial [Streptomyces broussonetiae]|uniref:hypothetical protein n=1 Tax=Streptomyces broussonetiae TaxID=2686304 RepID=UPI0035DFF47D
MNQQGVHPEGAAGTPDATARPGAAGAGAHQEDTDTPKDDATRARGTRGNGAGDRKSDGTHTRADDNNDTEGAHVSQNTPPDHGPV